MQALRKLAVIAGDAAEESSEEEKEGHSDSEESQSSSRSFEAIEKIYGANSAQPKSTNY